MIPFIRNIGHGANAVPVIKSTFCFSRQQETMAKRTDRKGLIQQELNGQPKDSLVHHSRTVHPNHFANLYAGILTFLMGQMSGPWEVQFHFLPGTKRRRQRNGQVGPPLLTLTLRPLKNRLA
jgi:hypothetical protein